MNIIVEYNGKYPNLCSGDLVVFVDDVRWQFPDYCLESGGRVLFDDEWGELVESGEWKITEWPEGFPKDLKTVVLDAVNEQVEHGCCGGCI